MSKVSVIGAGNVGATCAFVLALKNIEEIILLDVVKGLAEGKAIDMMQSKPILGFAGQITGTSDYSFLKNSKVVVITAGLARKPGMSRQDLLEKNASIINEVVMQTKNNAPDSKIILVTNPLDIMTYLAYKVSGFEPNRVFGMAGVLDTARYRYFVSDKVSVMPNQVEALIIGSHADDMVVLDRLTKIDGQNAIDKLGKSDLETVKDRTKKAGAEIVGLLKTGSAYFAPGAAAAKMAEAVIKDTKEQMPACAYLNGEFGFSDVYAGVPVVIGKNGVERIIEIELTDDEKADFDNSIGSIKKALGDLKL
ncbi:MAG: malate dehydrogenase [Actinobacteria bacterium]|nr:MAG: malate dehydrogenase [Actinomycetota bacterium]